MSDKEVKKEQEKEKVVTRYDRKMQRREEEKRKEQQQRKIAMAVGVVVVIALVAFAASFPVRAYLATHEPYVTINGEDITKVEFDYNYNNVVTNYVNQNGSFLSYFGLDVTQDFSTQMYSDNLSWKDYFEEMTVENMKKTKGLKAEADASGYVYDASKEIENFKTSVKEAAKSAETSTKAYIRQAYGQYATINNISEYMAETARVNAYFEELSESMKASDEEIDAYYEENKADYDSVDYYLATFSAEFPAEDATDEEIDAAMNDAYELALAAEDNLMEEGNLHTNVKQADADYEISDWLFDESRTSGDTTVIDDADNNMYYAVQFVKRYRDEALTANVRVVVPENIDGQALLDEWNAGEATEDSFAELCDKYGGSSTAKGGLIEGVAKSSVSDELADWIFADGRAAGDTGVVSTESGYTYVIYYVGQGDPEWKSDIANTLLSEAQAEYTDALAESAVVEDKKGKLHYLKVRAEEEASDADDADDVGEEEDVSDGDIEDMVSDSDVE
ncbi:MAG: hypothetical protein NC092_05125 [Butyrivibrio sp.]|nr:hypothetical protein [Muribaculum sp.]MCM1552056.1 hypothetical protein [Butyrivibrio sp.]